MVIGVTFKLRGWLEPIEITTKGLDSVKFANYGEPCLVILGLGDSSKRDALFTRAFGGPVWSLGFGIVIDRPMCIGKNIARSFLI